MLYQLRPPTIEATQIAAADMAAQLLGGEVVDAPDGCWAVEVERDGVLLRWEGRLGDYLASNPWRVMPRQGFEADWVASDVVLTARTAQAAATTILGLRRASLDVTDSALIGVAL